MIKIELIYDSACPNIERARTNLSAALAQLSLAQTWVEWNRSDPNAPSYVKKFGSPAVLVEGVDVAAAVGKGECNACRIYHDENGTIEKAPSIGTIKDALFKTGVSITVKKIHLSSLVSSLLAVAATLLPAISCPACWIGYASFFSSIGVGFFNYTPYLFPITLLLLLFSLWGLHWAAKKRKDYKAFVIGVISSLVILFGKFAVEIDVVTWIGTALLVGASIWNISSKKSDL